MANDLVLAGLTASAAMMGLRMLMGMVAGIVTGSPALTGRHPDRVPGSRLEL